MCMMRKGSNHRWKVRVAKRNGKVGKWLLFGQIQMRFVFLQESNNNVY